MKKVFKELKPFMGYILCVIVTVFGGVWGNLNLPNHMASIIDNGIPTQDIPFILRTGSIMLGYAILAMVCNILTSYFAAKSSVGLGRNLRKKVFVKVESFSQGEFDRFSTASLITRTNNDILQLQNFMMMFLRVIIMSPVMCIAGIAMAAQRSSSMSMVLLFSMPALFILVWLISRKAIPLSTVMQDKLDRVNLVLREKLTGVRVIRAFGTEKYEEEKFGDANTDLTNTTLQMMRLMNLLMPALLLVLNFTSVAILWRGGMQVPDGIVSTGDILAVIQYVMQIMMSVMMLSMVFVMYPRASASSKRIYEILETVPEINDPLHAADIPDEKGYLEFRNVTFSFPNAETPALVDISFTAKPGETTAIIGSTGSGKSALVNLIPRFYDVQSGGIFVDGVDVREYRQETLRQKIGYVPQKALLFRGSIEENIQFGAPDADHEQIWKAAEIAQAKDFIQEKQAGLSYSIAQGGTNVSGGQRQRLSIARAIVRKPEIYIFDDSFSALDFKTDAALREALGKETRDATVVIVAQRVSTIMNADRILVLEHGRLVGNGTHQQLMAECETYREIVYSQLSEKEVG